MKKSSTINVGTSGWHYKHWKNVFYPTGIKDAGQFQYYSSVFRSVEINNSFYKLPSPETFTSWRQNSPKGFLFAVKASRFITHMKKLNFDRAGLDMFFDRVTLLQEKLGPILFQLPPRWKINTDRLSHFLSILPPHYRYAFEFRDPSWYNPAVYQLLHDYNCSFCIYELAGHLSPSEVTSDMVYVRLHGPSANKYKGDYADKDLQVWSERCLQWKSQKKDVYIYFDNDHAGYAAKNARSLQELINIH